MKCWRFLPFAFLVLAACATTGDKQQPKSEPLTPEARVLLDRALTRPGFSGLYVDLAAMEEQGLVSKQDGLRDTMKVVSALLPFTLSEAEDDAELREVFARLIVSASMLGEVAEWPNIRGYAFTVPDMKGEDPAGRGLMVVAVAQPLEQNRDLVTSLTALSRAVMADEYGRDVTIEVRGNDACLLFSKGPPACIRAGPGYFLLGAQQALSAFSEAGPAQPAAAPAAQEERALIRAHVNLGQATVDLRVRGGETLQLEAFTDSTSPVFLARAQKLIEDALAEYDQKRAAQKEAVAAALPKMQAAIASDPTASPALKQAAATLTVDKVLDPHGYWTTARQSLKTERTEQRFALSMTVPAGAVGELREMVRSGGSSTLVMMGSMAAIAIPNFLKFQCRAKQSEAKTNLKSLFVAQKMYASEHDRWAKTFKDADFRPEAESRYTYCMGKDCAGASKDPGPCEGATQVGKTLSEGFRACAWANLDGDPGVDVWTISDDGYPEPGESDCE